MAWSSATNTSASSYRRWTQEPGVHPHEAFVGLAALLHGASIQELRYLVLDDLDVLDHARHRLHLGKRRTALPLDPVTWNALESCLKHRSALKTSNPHVIVTEGTKLNSAAAFGLDPEAALYYTADGTD
jgi:hypothetical protein